MLSAKRILVIAPHPDDETLGVGGCLAKCAAAGGQTAILTVAAHKPPLYSEERHATTIAEARQAHARLGVGHSVFLDFPAVTMEELPTPEFNRAIQGRVEEFHPDLLLIPYPDRHLDHRRIFDAAMVAARPINTGRGIRLLAAYETLSETHWNAPHIEPSFTPNWVEDITGTIDVKLEAMRCYQSQLHAFPGPRSMEAVRALALFRGSQAGFAYGEGFHVIRMTSYLDA